MRLSQLKQQIEELDAQTKNGVRTAQEQDHSITKAMTIEELIGGEEE